MRCFMINQFSEDIKAETSSLPQPSEALTSHFTCTTHSSAQTRFI
jgi:hypothetical protein